MRPLSLSPSTAQEISADHSGMVKPSTPKFDSSRALIRPIGQSRQGLAALFAEFL
jgi:hypothetical protein